MPQEGKSSLGESNQQICLLKIDFCVPFAPVGPYVGDIKHMLWVSLHFFCTSPPNHLGYHFVVGNVFRSGCCWGDTVWLGPFPPTLNLSPPPVSRSALNLSAGCISLQPSEQSCSQILSISDKTSCLPCHVTLMSYVFYSLICCFCNMARKNLAGGPNNNQHSCLAAKVFLTTEIN